MKILAADEAGAWLKQRRKTAPNVTDVVSWPEDAASRATFASQLATMSGWRDAAIILERPGMPRPQSLADLCSFQAAHGVQSTPADIQLGNYPGHLLDGASATNQALVRELLSIMMIGYIEGHLITKDGRFWATVGCGIVEFRVADKSLSVAVRQLTRG